MPFKILRNDITKMECDAIVNTASADPLHVGPGCHTAIFEAAGLEEIALARAQYGFLCEGDAVITEGFNLPAKYVIHAVSPLYRGGIDEDEEKLRNCYRNSLRLAKENNLSSIAFPLISSGSFHFPKEIALRIAIDEITAFLMTYEMLVYIVLFDDESVRLGSHLEENICCNFSTQMLCEEMKESATSDYEYDEEIWDEDTDMELIDETLEERLSHMTDTFSEYMNYLMEKRGLQSKDVYQRGVLKKQGFLKIKSNPGAHPKKDTVFQICVGMHLNLDETIDMLARAGYAFSPCDTKDTIVRTYIEHEFYSIIDIDIALEEHGYDPIIE